MTNDSIRTQKPDQTIAPESTDESNIAGKSGGSWMPGPADFVNVVRGFFMGAADTVPGVSGGTVALILGHYQRLIAAISRIDGHFVSLAGRGKCVDAFAHIDGRFLVALAMGIACGIVSLAGLMHWLLDHRMAETLAVFLGLVLASVWVVRREIEVWTADRWIALGFGAVVAAGITMLAGSAGSLSLPYLFFSASIAICAMILPGISGAFIMLLLGVYYPVTGMVKDAAKLNFTPETLIKMAVFASGCLFGLLAFSKVLRFLLARFRDTTMAVLIGLMIGSVGRLWPFQVVTPETADLDFKARQFDYVSPAAFTGSVPIVIGCVIAGAAVVLIAESVASRLQHS
ncbi:DUF368 domain-containing protein [Crateriforma conspicua]|uniref:DUF368 domain-containing protein n=1 Tax=Crateriforma conspicua TaxID=2527996 RepID=UPI001189CD64|nr:DUF368 domain-containing protein [Crateriforma conspicua]QDV63282.1 hypothetical protein Mal65_24240 [Crateriforma conspicua]